MIRRLIVIAVAAAGLAGVSACGREGGVALPDNARFCELAKDLSAGAAASIGPLGPNPPLAKLAIVLNEFVQSRAGEYRELNDAALPYVRTALARQRAAQRVFINAQTDGDRAEAYNALARNGAKVVLYEQQVCR